MNQTTKHGRLWLTLIGASYTALALGATFAPGILNQPIADGPATWGLAANALYLVFVIAVMGVATRPFARSDDEEDQ